MTALYECAFVSRTVFCSRSSDYGMANYDRSDKDSSSRHAAEIVSSAGRSSGPTKMSAAGRGGVSDAVPR